MANPLKRARNEAADESDTPIILSECTRHSDLWFNDGSIVLCVQKTLFLVHRTMLCTHSVIFSDMFSLPQSSDEHMIEGCPVVWLSDRACDVEHLLKAVYNPFFRPNLMSADQLEGILRLSTKYEMPIFRQECISYIISRFPSELSDFDSPDVSQPLRPSCFWAVTMAREFNIPGILPLAMYLCTQQPARAIIDGDGDGRYRLSQSDQNICWEAREQLESMTMSKVLGFLYSFQPHPRCESPRKCKNGARGNISIFYDRSCFSYSRKFKALENEDFSKYKPYVCHRCVAAMVVSHRVGRQAVWDALPGLCGLGSWQEIFPPDPTEDLESLSWSMSEW